MILKMRCENGRRWLAVFALATTAGVCVTWQAARAGGTEPAGAQNTFNLERRISIVEQRLNTIELSINRLEQQSRLSTVAPSSTQATRDTEVELLRSQVELLQRRVAEDECGILRVDERTLAQAARERERKDEAGREDPCRLNPDAPLRLSARQ